MFKRAAFFENLGSRDGSGNCAYADRIFPQGFSVDLFFDVVRVSTFSSAPPRVSVSAMRYEIGGVVDDNPYVRRRG